MSNYAIFPPGVMSDSPLNSARSSSFDFTTKPDSEDEDGRQRATVTFDSDSGGFFEVSYDAPSMSKSSPRDRSSSTERQDSIGERIIRRDSVSPQSSRSPRVIGDSARSIGSLDTEVLLKDTEHVMKAMADRVSKGKPTTTDTVVDSKERDFNPYSNSPIDKSELFLPIRDDDSDSDVGGVLVNGDRRKASKSGCLDRHGQPIQLSRDRGSAKTRSSLSGLEEKNSKPISSREKVLMHYHSRTANKRNDSTDNDNVGVSDDSETASVVSTSTDYSVSSPKLGRKTTKSKGNITMTRTNRAFALRRQNADSDNESSKGGRSSSLTRPGSAGSSRPGSRPGSAGYAASPRSSTGGGRPTTRTRPSSAKESTRSDASLGTRIVNKSRDNQRDSSKSSANPAFVRKDGGRHSLRSTKAGSTSSAQSSTRSSESRDLSKPRTPRSRSNTGPGLAITGNAPQGSNRSGPATTKAQDYEAWKRRKSYDPRKVRWIFEIRVYVSFIMCSARNCCWGKPATGSLCKWGVCF